MYGHLSLSIMFLRLIQVVSCISSSFQCGVVLDHMNVSHFIHRFTILLDISSLKCGSVLSGKDCSVDLWRSFLPPPPPALCICVCVCVFTFYLTLCSTRSSHLLPLKLHSSNGQLKETDGLCFSSPFLHHRLKTASRY